MTAGPVDLPAGCSHGLRGRVLGSTVPMMKTAADHRPVVWRETGRPRWSSAVAGCGRRGSAAASMVSDPASWAFGSCSCTVSDLAAARPSCSKKKKKSEAVPTRKQGRRMLRARVENPIRFRSPEPNYTIVVVF